MLQLDDGEAHGLGQADRAGDVFGAGSKRALLPAPEPAAPRKKRSAPGARKGRTART